VQSPVRFSHLPRLDDNKGPFKVKATLPGGRKISAVQTEGVDIARAKKRAKQASAVVILIKSLERWVFLLGKDEKRHGAGIWLYPC
jgi:hypothetical protein